MVRCYEVGINKTATVETMANLLQEVACNHVQSLGFSTDGFATSYTMRKMNLTWVNVRMHIEIYKYPAWSDVVEIETWFHGEGRIGTRGEWILKDYANGQVIGRATSKRVIMNQETRRLQMVNDDVRDEYLIFCPRESSLGYPELIEPRAHWSCLGQSNISHELFQHIWVHRRLIGWRKASGSYLEMDIDCN
ncbi:hypothetical protein ACJRO7_029887 [Eucalyptus globulus]|uniref:Acyl-[acyl-carrier-protein] hydrolase n=1 Tax=Eucalyptus globulus TaxID=34317 RepID=A0ABD3JFS8_EUCGL